MMGAERNSIPENSRRARKRSEKINSELNDHKQNKGSYPRNIPRGEYPVTSSGHVEDKNLNQDSRVSPILVQIPSGGDIT